MDARSRYRLPESVRPDHTTKRSIRRTDYNLEECLWAIMCPLTMALLILAVLMLGGCAKTVYVPVESVTIRNDSAYKAVYIDRLIIERDTVNTYTKGDTVFKESVKWRVRNVESHDTIVSIITDSVRIRDPVPVEVPVYVEKNLKWYQTALIYIGLASLIGIAIAVWWLIRRGRQR